MSATVYRVFDAADRLLYVGCTDNLNRRLGQHEDKAEWWPLADHVSREDYATRAEAEAAEVAAIGSEHPRWNAKDRSPDHPDGPFVHNRRSPLAANRAEREALRQLRLAQEKTCALRRQLVEAEAELAVAQAAVDALTQVTTT